MCVDQAKDVVASCLLSGVKFTASRLKKSNEMQQYTDIYLLLNCSTCLLYVVTFEEACSPDSMICTTGCNYSFMYS